MGLFEKESGQLKMNNKYSRSLNSDDRNQSKLLLSVFSILLENNNNNNI